MRLDIVSYRVWIDSVTSSQTLQVAIPLLAHAQLTTSRHWKSCDTNFETLQVAAALLAHDAPPMTEVGIIPMGTANDFATGLGIPADPWEALQLALCTPAQPIDVGIVNEQVRSADPYNFLQPHPIWQLLCIHRSEQQ